MADQHESMDEPKRPERQPWRDRDGGRLEVPEELRALRDLATRSGLEKLEETLPAEHFITTHRSPLPEREPREDGGPIEHQWPPESADRPDDDTPDQ